MPAPLLHGHAADDEVALRSPPVPPDAATSARLDFSAVYDAHFHEVCRWIRALGGPEAELEDLAQEVFLVVRRKLVDFDGGNLQGWLYRISANTVSDQRRRAWFRNLFQRPRDVELDGLASTRRADDPAEELERKQASQTVWSLLARLSAKRRAAFVLFEIEGYTGDEIARLEGIPVATVWTRLHHARKDFLRLVEELEESEGV